MVRFTLLLYSEGCLRKEIYAEAVSNLISALHRRTCRSIRRRRALFDPLVKRRYQRIPRSLTWLRQSRKRPGPRSCLLHLDCAILGWTRVENTVGVTTASRVTRAIDSTSGEDAHFIFWFFKTSGGQQWVLLHPTNCILQYTVVLQLQRSALLLIDGHQSLIPAMGEDLER